MTGGRRIGRPKASSQATLAEAACELFLERGYEATSVADIAQRAGVSRSSFFNYFSSKSDVLWSGLDARIEAMAEALASTVDTDGVAHVFSRAVSDFAPDSLALALTNADAMGLAEDLDREGAIRQARVAGAVAAHLRRAGVEWMQSEIQGAVWAAALMVSIRSWARLGAGRGSVAEQFSYAARMISES